MLVPPVALVIVTVAEAETAPKQKNPSAGQSQGQARHEVRCIKWGKNNKATRRLRTSLQTAHRHCFGLLVTGSIGLQHAWNLRLFFSLLCVVVRLFCALSNRRDFRGIYPSVQSGFPLKTIPGIPLGTDRCQPPWPSTIQIQILILIFLLLLICNPPQVRSSNSHFGGAAVCEAPQRVNARNRLVLWKCCGWSGTTQPRGQNVNC